MATTSNSVALGRYTRLNGKPFSSTLRVPCGEGAPPDGWGLGQRQRVLEGRQKTRTGSGPRRRVVRHLVQQLGLRLRQKAQRSHFASARALANTSSAGIA
jgi:hypothetical protein